VKRVNEEGLTQPHKGEEKGCKEGDLEGRRARESRQILALINVKLALRSTFLVQLTPPPHPP